MSNEDSRKMKCPVCKSTNIKHSFEGTAKAIFICQDCGHAF